MANRYYAFVDQTKDSGQITCPVKLLPERELEALLRAELTPSWATGQPYDGMPYRARMWRACSTPSPVR